MVPSFFIDSLVAKNMLNTTELLKKTTAILDHQLQQEKGLNGYFKPMVHC